MCRILLNINSTESSAITIEFINKCMLDNHVVLVFITCVKLRQLRVLESCEDMLEKFSRSCTAQPGPISFPEPAKRIAGAGSGNKIEPGKPSSIQLVPSYQP